MSAPYLQDVKPSLEDLIQDIEHPNPNINKNACSLIVRYWPEQAINIFIPDLANNDLILRRRSIAVLASFGEEILVPITKLFFSSNSKIIRISCLKIILKVISMNNINQLKFECLDVLSLALESNEVEAILIVVSIYKLIGDTGINLLRPMCKDQNILKAIASVSALSEIKKPEITDYFKDLINDPSLDQMILERIRLALS